MGTNCGIPVDEGRQLRIAKLRVDLASTRKQIAGWLAVISHPQTAPDVAAETREDLKTLRKEEQAIEAELASLGAQTPRPGKAPHEG